MTCYVCQTNAAASHEHHVRPQARGGRDGITVFVCPTCHQTIHNAAARFMSTNKHKESWLLSIAHLDEGAKRRARALVNAIVLAYIQEARENPEPLLTVKLKHPRLLRAAHQLKIQKGFTSLDALFNALLEQAANKYGF